MYLVNVLRYICQLGAEDVLPIQLIKRGIIDDYVPCDVAVLANIVYDSPQVFLLISSEFII